MAEHPSRSKLYDDDRIPAMVKHHLLEKYMEQLGIRIGRGQWDSLLYIDGFAGPWGSSPSHEDTSFGTAMNALAKAQRIVEEKWKGQLTPHAILVERSHSAFPKLKEFAARRNGRPVRIIAKKGRFERHIPFIQDYSNLLGPKALKFLLLDPKGWKGLAMDRIAPMVNRSSEILVNVMVRHLRRFLTEADRAESYDEFFGRRGVRDIVLATPAAERDGVLVREYCKSLKEVCDFDYVSSCLMLNTGKNEVRYFMVFGTNHHRGIEVFKEAETDAAAIQEQADNALRKRIRESAGEELELPLDDRASYINHLTKNHLEKATFKMRSLLESNDRVLYRDLFCEAAAFPLVTKKMILDTLNGMCDVHVQLEQANRKVPSCDRQDYYLRGAKREPPPPTMETPDLL